MNKEEVCALLELSISRLLKNDEHLIINDVNERSITHHLAVYISGEFAGWDVDCEYNRNGEDIKLLVDDHKFANYLEQFQDHVEADDANARTLYPDIIVHRRGTHDNLVVIELKKSTNPRKKDADIAKLQALKHQLGYEFALFIRLECGSQGDLGRYELEFVE